MIKNKLTIGVILISLLFTSCNFSSNTSVEDEEEGIEKSEIFRDILSSDDWTLHIKTEYTDLTQNSLQAALRETFLFLKMPLSNLK